MHLVIYYASDATSNWTRASIMKWWNKLWINLLSLSQVTLSLHTKCSKCLHLTFVRFTSQSSKISSSQTLCIFPSELVHQILPFVMLCNYWGCEKLFLSSWGRACAAQRREHSSYCLSLLQPNFFHWVAARSIPRPPRQPRQLEAAGELIISTSWGIDEAFYSCVGDKLFTGQAFDCLNVKQGI